MSTVLPRSIIRTGKAAPLLILMLLLSLTTTGCVIQTGQAGNTAQQSPQKESKEPIRESKISLDEAANFNMTLGAQYLKQDNIPQAIEKLEKAIEQRPNLALAHSYLGLAYEQFGESGKAKVHYRRAVKLDSNDPIALNNYGTFLCRHEEWRASLKYFEKAAKNRRYQTPHAAFANAGVCAKRIPDLAAAEGYFRSALKVNPRYAVAQYHLADINLEQNNLIVAQSFFKDYQKLVPSNQAGPDYLWLGYRLEKELGNLNEAGQYALQLQQRFPQSAETKQLLDRRN